MSQSIGRRTFIRKTAAVGMASGIMVANRARAATGESRVVVGVMGLNRGLALAKSFSRQTNVQLKYVCDVDQQRIRRCAEELKKQDQLNVAAVSDFRRILDDPEVDALVCAAPNHWHAPATILACQAGKHVYVEKPCSHNPREGELMVQAARDKKRAVQIGTQRRSSPGTVKAIGKLREGAIGRVYLARANYNSLRGSIGRGKPSSPPAGVDYDLWQGPAPRVPFHDNFLHYNWHWRWHWGNGELGNNGVHTIDLCRWGLDVDYPCQITSEGGRYVYDDDQETPDTHTVCFHFPDDRSITWQGLSCNKHGQGFVTFYGTDGTLALDSDGTFRIYDRADKLTTESSGTDDGSASHVQNFLSAVRTGDPESLNAEIAEGHRSTLLCHLGNIAHRTGVSLACRATDGHIADNESAQAMWSRDYEPGWEPKV